MLLYKTEYTGKMLSTCTDTLTEIYKSTIFTNYQNIVEHIGYAFIKFI